MMITVTWSSSWSLGSEETTALSHWSREMSGWGWPGGETEAHLAVEGHMLVEGKLFVGDFLAID